jgi:O-succinylbenzoate synthase
MTEPTRLVVERITLSIVSLELINAFRASTHAAKRLEHVLVRAEARGGLVGWGECSTTTDPYYLGETTETAWHIARDFLAPAVLGKPWSTPAEFAALYGLVKGNTFAKAGLEMAAWDLYAQAAGAPVARALGGTRDEIASGVSLGMEPDPGRLFELIDDYRAQGYRRVKLKVGPGHDLDVLERVRARYPDLPLMADANSAYTLDDVAHLKAFDAFDLMMIEQPLAWHDFVDHAKLQRELRTPLCLDESIRSLDDARHALDLGSCRVVNVKVARVGGLVEAKRIHDLCLARGVPVWCGGMHDYGIGRAANVALASLPGFTIPGDVSGSDKYFREDLIEPPFRAVGGAIRVPTGPGWGHEVVEARVRAATLRETTLGPA